MFNRQKIRELQAEVEWLKKERSDLKDRYWRLRHDIDLLAKHQGLEFEDVHERVLKGGKRSASEIIAELGSKP